MWGYPHRHGNPATGGPQLRPHQRECALRKGRGWWLEVGVSLGYLFRKIHGNIQEIFYLVANYPRIVSGLVHPSYKWTYAPTYPIEITRVVGPTDDSWVVRNQVEFWSWKFMQYLHVPTFLSRSSWATWMTPPRCSATARRDVGRILGLWQCRSVNRWPHRRKPPLLQS